MSFRHKGASAQLRFLDGTEAVLVNVHSVNRGQGEGSELMQKIVDYADRNDINIYLRAQRFSVPRDAPNNHDLVAWYQKFGFHITTRYGDVRTMRRISRENRSL